MPSATRASSLSRWWVVVVGWVRMLRASPRLFEMTAMPEALRKRKAAALSASSSASIVPPPCICRAEIAACGWSARPG